MMQYSTKYSEIQQKIKLACEKAHRDFHSVQLLAVSKTQPIEAIQTFYNLGQRAFGENYLQEALEKINSLTELSDIEWHFIGHIQRNKTKQIANYFSWVHGVDRLIIAERLSNQRLTTQPPLNICLQVNIDQQDSKDGCQIEEVASLVEQISLLPNLRLRGLMIIPHPDNTEAFNQAKQLFDRMKTYHHHSDNWDTLSMGMSNDLETAIIAGSTIVRIGTALFGQRHYNHF